MQLLKKFYDDIILVVRKYLFFGIIFFIILYYISTFIISFTIISKAVVNNNQVILGKYLNEKSIELNFIKDINNFTSEFTKSIDKNIKIKTNSIEFTGEVTSHLIERLFSRISQNIAKDFSTPEVMLYFYFNSNEISSYLDKSFTLFGNYNFEKYLLEKQNENIEESSNNEENTSVDEESKAEEIGEPAQPEEKEDNVENIIFKIIKRINSTNYFFLSSPYHFKISAKHQEIDFVLILKFNGYLWKLEKIEIPYKELIKMNNITLVK